MDVLASRFPNLLASRPTLTSYPTPRFNCVAWAASDTTRWWWPDEFGLYYWPHDAPRIATIAAFERAFASLGYESCPLLERDDSFERVALFTDDDGSPTHAARMLRTGAWTSKLGEWIDVEHDLQALEGPGYGSVRVLMRRPWR